MSQNSVEITLDSEGYDPINLERMPISEWINLDSDSNIVLLFRKEIYLINASLADGVLSRNVHVECGKDNEPLLDKNTKTGEDLYGVYYNLSDIGIPDLMCEKDNWEEIIMGDTDSKFFIIEEDKNYPTIRTTKINSNNCKGSRSFTVGVISKIEIPSTGGMRKKKSRRNNKIKRKSKKNRKSIRRRQSRN